MVWGLLALVVVIVLVLSSRYAWWRPATDYKHPRVLMYHMVRDHLPDARFNKLRVPVAEFEKHVRWLKENGWYFATISELENPETLPAKTVAITFDDGFEDNFTNAHPILEKYDAKATLYLVIDRHDRDWSTSKKAHHDSGELKAEPKLSDEQVRSMLESGVWELGGHTRTHANLAKLDDAAKNSEIGEARSELQAQFGVELRSFAYPFGIYDRSDVEAVERAGFTTAVTTEAGISGDVNAERLELQRIKVSGKESLYAFCLRLKGGKRGWRK